MSYAPNGPAKSNSSRHSASDDGLMPQWRLKASSHVVVKSATRRSSAASLMVRMRKPACSAPATMCSHRSTSSGVTSIL